MRRSVAEAGLFWDGVLDGEGQIAFEENKTVISGKSKFIIFTDILFGGCKVSFHDKLKT